MTRRHFSIACEQDRMVASLDEATGTTGLLIVTGGNETRSGAWNGQALFARRIAETGHPVLRFDRRGVGDSEGENRGFAGSAPDLAAAAAAFREQCPHITRIVGLGNCDAASALMLAGGADLDALVLSNPWTFEASEAEGGDDAPAEVVRDHYRRRLSDPTAIKRLLTGKVSLPQLTRSLIAALHPSSTASGDSSASLIGAMAQGIAEYPGSVRFLVAERDRTGLAFVSRWKKGDQRIRKCAGATHSYVEPHAQDWLAAQVLEALRSA